MNDGNQAKKLKRKRWLLRGVCVVASIVILPVGIVWWIMIRMPGASYQGELPARDESLKSLGDELRRQVQYLAVERGLEWLTQ